MPRALAERTFYNARLLAAAVSLACASDSVAAQATTATLHGVISGADGSVPKGARIEIRSRETARSRSALANPRGSYRVLGLAPDVYDVTVRAIGYRQQRREGLRLVVGQRVTLNFALERGAVELEPAVITSERPFELHRTDVSTAVLQEEIEKLPLNSRNVLNLAAIGAATFRLFLRR